MSKPAKAKTNLPTVAFCIMCVAFGVMSLAWLLSVTVKAADPVTTRFKLEMHQPVYGGSLVLITDTKTGHEYLLSNGGFIHLEPAEPTK